MKKIYFDKMNSWKNGFIILLAAVCMIISWVGLGKSSPSLFSKLITIMGYLLVAVVVGKMFITKNYAGWNKRGMYLRIGYFSGNNVRFNSIRSIDFNKGRLKIKRILENTIELDLEGINKNDTEKLIQIFKEHASNCHAPK